MGDTRGVGKRRAERELFWPQWSWLPACAVPETGKPLGTEDADSVGRTKIKRDIS